MPLFLSPDGSLCTASALIAVLYLIGRRVVPDYPRIRTGSIRLGYVTFLAATSAMAVAGNATSANAILGAIVVGLVAGALLTTALWVVLPVGAVMLDFLFRFVWWTTTANNRLRVPSEPGPLPPPPPMPLPVKTPAELEAEAEQARLAEADRLQRDEALFAAEREYLLLAPKLTAAFPPAKFDEYVKRHLHTGQPVQVVERRRDQLIDLMRVLAGQSSVPGPVDSRSSPDDLLRRYQARTAAMRALAIPEELKDQLIYDLELELAEQLRAALQADPFGPSPPPTRPVPPPPTSDPQEGLLDLSDDLLDPDDGLPDLDDGLLGTEV